MKRFIPDYKGEVDKIFLVSPIGLRDELWDEYNQFLIILHNIIKEKNKNQKIVLICDSQEGVVDKTISSIRIPNVDMNIFEFKKQELYDIWIRDYFCCANIIDEEGKIGALRANYCPSYNAYAMTDDAAGILLANEYFEDIYTLGLKLEGGNLVSNDNYVFITNKIYTENFAISKDIIDKAFKNNFYQKLISVPTENLDIIGHTDGILRCLDDKKILLPIYNAEYKMDNRYVMNLKNELSKNLGPEYQFVFIPSYLDDTINEENIFSSKGVYVNYLRFEDHIIFPSFEKSSYYEREIARIISKQLPNINIHFSPCNDISYWGGGLHCITNIKYR